MIMFFVFRFSSILFFIELLLSFTDSCYSTSDNDEGQSSSQRFRVDGTVSVPFTLDQSWTADTRVVVDGGHRLAFLRSALISACDSRSFMGVILRVVNKWF